MKSVVALMGMHALLAWTSAFAASALKADEQVVLYPAIARPRAGGWDLEVHGIVYEPERQRFLTGVLRRVLGIDDDDLTAAERAIWRSRSRYFVVDNERGKRLTIQLGSRVHTLGTSAANGHFQSTLRLRAEDVPKAWDGIVSTNMDFPCDIGSPKQPARPMQLEVVFLSEAGLSVISDIDDTIKISNVRDREAMIQNTFCQPFKPVPGLADVYREWSGAGAQFHYLTASPWQLYLPLSEFVRSNGFPSGTFHMKNFRLKDGSFIDLFKSPERYKPAVIEELLRSYPKRQFVLVGDSGEKDPEIYGTIARRFPNRIRRILIRDVTGEAADDARYDRAFKGVPRERWQLFKSPSEITR